MLRRTLVSIALLTGCAEAAVNEQPVDANVPRDLGAVVDAGSSVDAASLDMAITADSGAPDAGSVGPTRYPADENRSPITPSVVERMREIAGTTDELWNDVFMKVGASGTVSRNLLHCFAGAGSYRTDLDGRTALSAAIAHFNAGSAAGTDPFTRVTLAAEGGRSASWAIAGTPSPIEREFEAILPQFALVNYGTNDMGGTPSTALPAFYDNMNALLDDLESRGVVPIVTGLNPRSDSALPAQWVATFDAVTLAIAEARQIPYISLYRATKDLPNFGLLSDGIHGNVFTEGSTPQPCVFTNAALQYNYNVRNLLSIETLADVWSTVTNNAPAPDSAERPLVGDGTPENPFVIDRLPFTHFANTASSPTSEIDDYMAGCSAAQNESGPEFYYTLALPTSTRLRFVVMDLGTTDVDVHVLGGDGVCEKRGHHYAQGAFGADSYSVVVDSFVASNGTVASGEYVLVALECDPADTSCD